MNLCEHLLVTTQIPRSALVLAVAGLVPLVWSVATQLSPSLADFGLNVFGPRFVGPYVGLVYGTIILSFMSGVLWGFSTQATGKTATFGFGVSVMPALWAFFFVGNGPVSAALMLALGFAGLLVLDFAFWRLGFAPAWWMRLRLPLTAAAVGCLCATAFV